MAELIHTPGHEKISYDKNESSNPESYVYREIDSSPVGSLLCEIPWSTIKLHEMEDDWTYYQENNNDR